MLSCKKGILAVPLKPFDQPLISNDVLKGIGFFWIIGRIKYNPNSQPYNFDSHETSNQKLCELDQNDTSGRTLKKYKLAIVQLK